jgi:RNA polymerase sigma-70 factor (ECF subfamily)
VYQGRQAHHRPSAEAAALIERARQGHHGAYGDLVRDHQEIAFRVAFLITRSAPDAEDVTQEAFLKAWRALDRFRAGAPFRPWLLRIVANEARNRVRSNRRRRHVPAWGPEARHAPEAAADPVDPEPSPEDRMLATEERRRLLAALDRLRDDDRVVISARYLLELSEAEMAEALGIARGTVKSRLSRAMSRLRASLEGST